MSTLAALQARWGPEVDEFINNRIGSTGLEPSLAVMLRYQLGYCDSAGNPTPGFAGKRFRPLLCLLAAQAVGGRWEDAMPLATAIELLHNFSLIHDDIEDQDPLRRHRATVWTVWTVALAINAGDTMFALAKRALLDLSIPAATALSVATRFEDTGLALTNGQHRDMESESSAYITVDAYMRTIALKSAALIGFSVWSGAICGGGTQVQSDALEQFGFELGISFQIQDDILGIWAASGDTGKEAAKDLTNRKKTLPILLAAGRAGGNAAEVLHAYLRGDNLDNADVVSALEETDARYLATERLRFHLDRARTALSDAGLDHPHTDMFEHVAREVTRQ